MQSSERCSCLALSLSDGFCVALWTELRWEIRLTVVPIHRSSFLIIFSNGNKIVSFLHENGWNLPVVLYSVWRRLCLIVEYSWILDDRMSLVGIL